MDDRRTNPESLSMSETAQSFRVLYRIPLAGGLFGATCSTEALAHSMHLPQSKRERGKKACSLLFLIPSSKPSKILRQKDYPLTPTSSQPVVSLRPQLNWSRGAGEVSSQKKSLLLVIKYHLNCTGPSGISWVSKGHSLMRMQTF